MAACSNHAHQHINSDKTGSFWQNAKVTESHSLNSANTVRQRRLWHTQRRKSQKMHLLSRYEWWTLISCFTSWVIFVNIRITVKHTWDHSSQISWNPEKGKESKWDLENVFSKPESLFVWFVTITCRTARCPHPDSGALSNSTQQLALVLHWWPETS